MTGSSIAARDAAPWITDFLNASYYRRGSDRDVDDLRLAFCILTTFWYRRGGRRRLRIADVVPFHRAFGADRFSTDGSGRGTLSRSQLLDGASRLLGEWFPGAYADDARRGWGIAFETVDERAAYAPERRLALAKVGPLTPESAPPAEQVWHTYPPVEMPSADAVIAALVPSRDVAGLRQPHRPLHAAARGRARRTDIRDRGRRRHGQGPPGVHPRIRTITQLVTPDDPEALAEWFAALEDGMARYGKDEPRVVPEGATPVVGFDLTTHRGHFMGSGHNRLGLDTTTDGKAWVKAAWTWDPMPWHLEQAYRVAGRDAQHAFWGQGDDAAKNMLHQLALRIA